MRHGVQSSNCARSCPNASLNVGVVTSGAMLDGSEGCSSSLGEGQDGESQKASDGTRRAPQLSSPPKPAPPATTFLTTRAWPARHTFGTMSAIEALYIFDEHK
jgi:hypothetical protein